MRILRTAACGLYKRAVHAESGGVKNQSIPFGAE
jgi:hypothetical protein